MRENFERHCYSDCGMTDAEVHHLILRKMPDTLSKNYVDYGHECIQERMAVKLNQWTQRFQEKATGWKTLKIAKQGVTLKAQGNQTKVYNLTVQTDSPLRIIAECDHDYELRLLVRSRGGRKMKQQRKRREDLLHFENYASEIGGKLTFVGVMQKHLDEITRHWAKDTRRAYYGHYEDRLFPLIPALPLEELTEADFETVIETLSEQGIERGAPFSDRDLQHYRHLLRVVTKAADKCGVCSDVLWGGRFQEDDSAEHKAKIKVKPRSLSTGEEYRIRDYVLLEPEQAGELMGIAVMFCLGTRNQEACGLDWESFVYEEGDDMGFLRIVSSTEQGSNKLKAGGKTYNAPRILPVTGLLLDLLAARKGFLQRAIERGSLINDETGERIEKIDGLPIVCREHRYCVRCGADDLTRRTKAMLKEIHLDEDILEEANDLLEQRFANTHGERDVTAYLFRRNFSTHMSILGLEEETIHYLMGHVFSDEEVTKSRFTNGDTLRRIGEQMRKRAVINPDPKQPDKEIRIPLDNSFSQICSEPAAFTIDPEGKTAIVSGYLKPNGASELKVSLEYEKAPETGEIVLSSEQFRPESEISEKMTYRKIYGRKRERTENQQAKTIQ